MEDLILLYGVASAIGAAAAFVLIYAIVRRQHRRRRMLIGAAGILAVCAFLIFDRADNWVERTPEFEAPEDFGDFEDLDDASFE